MRQLNSNLAKKLDSVSRRTALTLTLGNGSNVYYSTSEFIHNGIKYEGKLSIDDGLNLEASEADEGLNFRITNTARSLGQWMINNQNVLDGTAGMLSCYFYDQPSAAGWLDHKLPGFIHVGDIDQDWIHAFFQSLGAKQYFGKTIAELFPDSQIPADEKPKPPSPRDERASAGGDHWNWHDWRQDNPNNEFFSGPRVPYEIERFR